MYLFLPLFANTKNENVIINIFSPRHLFVNSTPKTLESYFRHQNRVGSSVKILRKFQTIADANALAMHAIVLRVHAKLYSEWKKSLEVNSFRFRVSAICKNSEIDENWFLCLSCTVASRMFTSFYLWFDYWPSFWPGIIHNQFWPSLKKIGRKLWPLECSQGFSMIWPTDLVFNPTWPILNLD